MWRTIIVPVIFRDKENRDLTIFDHSQRDAEQSVRSKRMTKSILKLNFRYFPTER